MQLSCVWIKKNNNNSIFLFLRQLQKSQTDAQRRETIQVHYLQQSLPPDLQLDVSHAHAQRQEAVHVRDVRERLLSELWFEKTRAETARKQRGLYTDGWGIVQSTKLRFSLNGLERQTSCLVYKKRKKTLKSDMVGWEDHVTAELYINRIKYYLKNIWRHFIRLTDDVAKLMHNMFKSIAGLMLR